MSAESLIKAKIEQLLDRRRTHVNELRQVEGRLQAVNAQLTVLTEILNAANEDAGDNEEESGESSSEAGSVQVGPQPAMLRVRGRGVTFSVANLLRDNPSGMAGAAIIEALKDNIETNSSDRPRVIRNTLLNMRRRGALVEEGGVYRLAAANGHQELSMDDI